MDWIFYAVISTFSGEIEVFWRFSTFFMDTGNVGK